MIVTLSRISTEEAIEYLFKTQADSIHEFAYYMLHNREEAEDAVQDIFLRAARSIHTVRDNANLKAWVWVIARNYVRDVARREARHKNLLVPPEDISEMVRHSPSPSSSMIIEECLAALTIAQRQVVVLQIIQNLLVDRFVSKDVIKACLP